MGASDSSTQSEDSCSHVSCRVWASRLPGHPAGASRGGQPCAWSPGPPDPPTSWLRLVPWLRCMPLTPQAPFSFLPQRGPSSDSHQTCRTDVAQVPPSGD